MKLVLFGTGAFALPAIDALKDHIHLVVTQPDRPSGRGMKTHPAPAKLKAMELGIPFETPIKARAPEFVESLEAMRPDALVVASYGQILSQRLLDSAIRGGINLHGSILPKYRGAAPIQRCIQNHDQETGVTLMQMDKGMDTGDIIHIETCPIGVDETYGELQERLAIIAAQLASDWLPRICAGDYDRIPQNDAEATYANKIEKWECELDTRQPAQKEYAKFRAFTPVPGAFVKTKFGLLRVSAARLGTMQGPPGVVMGIDSGCEVAFGDQSIRLLEVQPEGKKRMSGRDFANGMRIKPGMHLI